MKLKIHLCIVSAVAALLFGCGMASDVMETQKKSDTIALALEKEIGVKPQIAWKIQNGTLAHINVQFPVDGVANLPIGELVSKVRTAVTISFDKPPPATGGIHLLTTMRLKVEPILPPAPCSKLSWPAEFKPI